MPQVVLGAAIAGGAFATAGSFAALTGFSLAAFQFGTSLVLSGISRELMPKPDPVSQSRTITARSPVAPREIVYGTVRKGGTIVFVHTSSDNSLLHLIIALAGHEVEDIGAIYANGERVFDDNVNVGNGRFFDKTALTRHRGAPGQVMTPHEPTDGLWTSSHKLSGVAAVYISLIDDFDVWTSGIPNFTADVQGRKVYDPRTDTTVWSSNAALCIADYMADATYGLGLSYGGADGIDEASLIEAANICDENVALDGGGTEKRYTMNGVVRLDQDPKTIIEGMLTAMAGKVIYRGGKWHIQAGAYRTPTVTLTEDDIREGGLTVSTKRALSEQFNGVRGQFVSSDNDWQPDDFPAYQGAVALAEDQGIEKWDDLSLPFTTSVTAAQRLAKIHLLRHRLQIRVQVSGKLSAWRAMTGETVMIDYARWGWSGKVFEVGEVSLAAQDGALVPELTLIETASNVYDWSATEEQVYAASPPTNLPSPWAIEPPGTVQIADDLYPTRPGLQPKVRMDISWSASPSGFVRAYEVQIKGPGETNWQAAGRTDALTLSVFDVKPGSWDVRVRAVSALGVTSAWTTITSDVIGLAAPPAAITGLTLQKAGGLAVLKWTLPEDPDVLVGGRVVIRHSNSAAPSWANSYQMDEVAGNQTIAVVPLKPGTYLLKAEDSSQILSPVATVGTDGAQAVPFTTAATSLQAQTAWSGTKTNVEVNVSDQLTLTDNTIEGIYEFATGFDFTTVKTVRLRSDIDMAIENLSSTIDDRLDPIDTWADFDDTEGAQVDIVVEGRFTDDDPSGTPTWTDWTRVDSTEVKCRGAEFRARLMSESAGYNILLTGLSIHADEVV